MKQVNLVDLLGLSLPLKALDLWWSDGIGDVTEPNNTLKPPTVELVPIMCNGSELPPARRDILQLMKCWETTSVAFWKWDGRRGHLYHREFFGSIVPSCEKVKVQVRSFEIICLFWLKVASITFQIACALIHGRRALAPFTTPHHFERVTVFN